MALAKTDRTAQTSPAMARIFTLALLGDKEAETPEGTPVYSYFATLDLAAAHEAYGQVYELPEGMRLRDIVERLGEDGTPV